MATDIKLNDDSVEVVGSLKVQNIVSENLHVTGGMSVVGVEEHIANGFTHLVLKPDSLVFETFHFSAGIKRLDVRQELARLAGDLKQVIADVKALGPQQPAPAPDLASEHQAMKRQIAMLERRVASLESKVK